MKFVFRISVGGWGRSIKFCDPVEDSNTSSPSSINVRMEYVFGFQYWYCELCGENQCRKHCFVNFSSLEALHRRWMRGGGVGQKSYLGPTEIVSFSSRILAEAKNMTYSDMLIDWIFLHFVFMNHYFFRFSSFGNLLKLRSSLVYYHFYSQQRRR